MCTKTASINLLHTYKNSLIYLEKNVIFIQIELHYNKFRRVGSIELQQNPRVHVNSFQC